jgi:hypothetical protein
MRRLRHLVPLVFVVVAAACSDDDDASDQVVGSPSEAEDTSTTTSTTASSTTTTAPFEGATTPTSIASDAASVALLTEVTVEATTVTFTFRDDVVPGIDAGYVSEVNADGSGEPVEVEGGAHLQIRMEPASGVDLSSSSGNFEETYTGPDRINAAGPIVEVVRTGDFEANLTWVIGVVDERPYRVDVAGSTVTVSVEP